MSVSQSFRFLRMLRPQACRRMLATDAGSGSGTSEKQGQAPPPPPPQKPAASSSGAADNTAYKCGAYYSHNEWSFYDIEGAMQAKRVGQPSSLKKPTA